MAMKKLLLFISIIALLAAACNNSQQASVPTLPTTQNTEDANTTPTGSQTPYCAGNTPTEIGGVVYPIDPKYGNLDELGQLFTANDCGESRLKEVTADRTDYDLGLTLVLKANPTDNLISLLRAIGFSCANNLPALTCKEWKLTKNVKVDELLKLQPFHKLFLRDDCINCG